MTPAEIFLLVFMIIFLLAAFVIIYLIITGIVLGPPKPPSPPVPPPTGPNTGNPPSSCNQNMLNDDFNCCVTGVVCNTAVLQFCTNGVCQCVTGSSFCPVSGFGGTPSCVFLNVDIANCGMCSRACTGGSTCCNGNCVDVLSTGSVNNCGKCGTVCTGANPTCCNGFCKDLSDDTQNCGACLFACGQGQLCCESVCTGPDNNDNCGFCGNACPVNTVCQNSTCVPGCPSGFLSCGGSCIDPLTSNTNCNGCGNVCSPGTYCQMGTCTNTSCSVPTEIYCPNLGYCISVQSNADFCGDCVTPCPNGPCVNGKCLCTDTTSCPSAYTCQPSTVVTPTVQPTGATGGTITGAGPGYCFAPSCLAGQVFCFNTQSCTVLAIDGNNCGSCGTFCGSGSCSSGLCTCPGGDIQCPNGYVCIAGTCQLR